MALMVKAGSGDDRPVALAGTYLATCCDVFSAGFWPNLDRTSDVEKVKVRFCFYEDAPEDDERWNQPGWQPELMYADVFETLSVGDKANLRKMLKTWRGEDLTPEEAAGGFDLERLLGAHAIITVEQVTSRANKVSAVVKNVARPMRGQTGPGIPPSYVPNAHTEWPMANAYPQGSMGKRVEKPQPQAAPSRPAPRPAPTVQAPPAARPRNDWNRPRPPMTAASGAPPQDHVESGLPAALEDEADDLPF